MKTSFGNWLNLGFDAFQLGIDASNVVALRSAKMSRGGKQAEREAGLMISEKMAAMMEFQAALMTQPTMMTPNALARTALDHYGRKVRANRKRLIKSA